MRAAMRTTALAARSRLVRQRGLATGGNPEECTLWVSYADPASLRRRLVGVAQQVRELLVARPLPELVLPLGNRVRQGFWFMRFQREALALIGTQTLQAQPFVAEIEHGGGERGAMSGTLQLDLGSRPTDLRAMLNLDGSEVREHEAWLRGAFGGHGEVEAIATPTLRCNWNPGYSFVTFAAPEQAEAGQCTREVLCGCGEAGYRRRDDERAAVRECTNIACINRPHDVFEQLGRQCAKSRRAASVDPVGRRRRRRRRV